jgi:hypothetical protein
VKNPFLGQTPAPAAPAVVSDLEKARTALQNATSAIGDAVRAQIEPIIIKAAIIGIGTGVLLGVFVTPLIQDLLGIRRAK